MVKFLNQALTFCITLVGNSIVRAISGQHPALNVISFSTILRSHILNVVVKNKTPYKALLERVQPPAHRMTEIFLLKVFRREDNLEMKKLLLIIVHMLHKVSLKF